MRFVKETRVLADQLSEELELPKYQAAYMEENKCANLPEFKPFVLTPPCRKQTFAPDVDQSIIIHEDSTF